MNISERYLCGEFLHREKYSIKAERRDASQTDWGKMPQPHFSDGL
jgi:hypothetical protein